MMWQASMQQWATIGLGTTAAASWHAPTAISFHGRIRIPSCCPLPLVCRTGDILFFDKKVSGTCRQMGATRSPAVSAEWSPDGRHLLIATTAPRLRVDNNFKVGLASMVGLGIEEVCNACVYASRTRTGQGGD